MDEKIRQMLREWSGTVLRRDGEDRFVYDVVQNPPASRDVVEEAIRRGVIEKIVSRFSWDEGTPLLR